MKTDMWEALALGMVGATITAIHTADAWVALAVIAVVWIAVIVITECENRAK